MFAYLSLAFNAINELNSDTLKKSGNQTVDGTLKANTMYAGSKAYVTTDNEGGKVYLISATGERWEIDALQSNLRFISYGTESSPATAVKFAIEKDATNTTLKSILNRLTNLETNKLTRGTRVSEIGFNDTEYLYVIIDNKKYRIPFSSY